MCQAAIAKPLLAAGLLTTQIKMVHELKTWPEYFEQVKNGNKPFDVRKNDRYFSEGDELLLKEYVPKGYYEDGLNDDKYTGRILHRKVSYILQGSQFGIQEGFVVMGLQVV